MLNILKINRVVLQTLRDRGNTDEHISQMSVNEAFDEFLIWHGIIGWCDTITAALNNLRAADHHNKDALRNAMIGCGHFPVGEVDVSIDMMRKRVSLGANPVRILQEYGISCSPDSLFAASLR